MTDDLWDRPVELMIENSDHFHQVRSSREAIACLMSSWPGDHTTGFAKARRTCMNAINGKARCEDAQAAFLKAAEEAGLLRH
jgi:hypothetical protein